MHCTPPAMPKVMAIVSRESAEQALLKMLLFGRCDGALWCPRNALWRRPAELQNKNGKDDDDEGADKGEAVWDPDGDGGADEEDRQQDDFAGADGHPGNMRLAAR
jgi:hypothetical protein